MSLGRQIVKHAAILLFPVTVFLGPFALISYIPETELFYGITEKRAAQVCFGGCAVVYALCLIHYYFKLIQQKLRAHRQVDIVEMQPVRMPHFCEHCTREATHSEVLPTFPFREHIHI